jgi:hypothetical protein
LKSRSITHAYKLVYVKDSAPRKPACPRGREEKIYMYKSIILEKGAESLGAFYGLGGKLLGWTPLSSKEKRGGAAPVEDAVIPLLPDQPGSQHEEFHKERGAARLFCMVHHVIKVQVSSAGDVEVAPASCTKGTGEE